jgi:hypothetical protein
LDVLSALIARSGPRPSPAETGSGITCETPRDSWVPPLHFPDAVLTS